MAIFTAIAAAIGLTGFFASAFVTVASIATSIGLSYVARALAGDPKQEDNVSTVQGVQGTLQSGADIPRSFNLGYSVTAGSLVYANTWGTVGETPNAYLTQVIALADLPGGDLEEVWVNGELCTLDSTPLSDIGYPVLEYRKDGSDYLWIKYHDGSQTSADPHLISRVSSADRPYESTRVGIGVAYVVVTSLVEDTLFSGFPTFKFAVSGVPLYDPTKDSTNGGTGLHRWSDSTTWGGDGDDFPAVQAYNIMRGIYYNGDWLYGLQLMTAARLPTVNWNAQIEKCRTSITGVSGPEPTYRTGGQIFVNAQIVHTIEALLTGCQGKMSEIGGFYKIHLGAPDSPTFSFDDDDILSSEEQNFAPFFGLSDSINGITAKYPDPAQGWNITTAPSLFNADFEAEDGGRLLLADPTFDFVPYSAQVQRLMKSALQEARRARRHSITLPPAFWIVEPGDVGEWSSIRNGYVTKQFRVDGVIDKKNLDVLFNLTEVDPTDYDWTHATDYVPGTIGPTVFPRPAPQGVVDWFAEPYTLFAGGQPRRAAILLSWDGSMPGVVGIQYEIRLASDASHVTRGRTDQLTAGAIIVSQSLIPNIEYEARGQYIPSAPRDMLWSDWLSVTTPNVTLSLQEFDAALQAQVTTIQDALNDRLDEIEQRFATLTSTARSQNWIDKKEVRSQLSSRSGAAFAEIENVQTVLTGADAALASDISTVTAQVATVSSQVTTNATAISTLDSAFSSYSTSTTATLGSLSSSVTTHSLAIATLDSAFSSYSTSTTATLGSLSSSVTTHSLAIATLDGYAAAAYSVTLDVNGYATGFKLVNGGSGISAFTITVDKFQIAAPGVSGGTAVPIFTVATVNGAAKVALRADMYIDGSITASTIAAGAITAIKIAAGAITADKIAAGAITTAKLAAGAITTNEIAVGGVDLLNIVAGAATKIYSQSFGGSTANTLNACSVSGTIISGTALVLLTDVSGTGANGTHSVTLLVDGVPYANYPVYSAANGTYASAFQWIVTGLSAASHTFTFSVSVSAGSFLSSGGVATVIDLRR